MPFSPGRISPAAMNDREWATFVAQQNIQATGNGVRPQSFTPTGWAGFSVDPVGDISYFDFGKIVVLWNDSSSQLVGTSDDTLLFFEGMPEVIWPDNNVILPTLAVNDGSTILASVSISAGGQVQFAVISEQPSGHLTVGGIVTFTASGNKGLPPGWVITYAK